MGTALAQAQTSLAPYIKSRKEASHIRQVLAAHLDSQLNHAAGHSQVPVYSLVHESTSVKTSSGTTLGLQKEYLGAVRANLKARREYDRVCNGLSLRNSDSASRDALSGSSYSATDTSDKSDQLESYLALIRQRQRHERLQILQDYVDKLEQKSAAATSYLNPSNHQLPGLPRLPVEIAVNSASDTGLSDQSALKDLVRGLEQAVLRAKVQLRREKQLLEQVRAGKLKGGQRDLSPVSRDVQTLQALGKTRNELITWVEQELGKAGDSEPRDAPEARRQPPPDTSESIEDQLVSLKVQYGRYVQARRTFIDTVTATVEPILANNRAEKKEVDAEDNENEGTSSTTWIIAPYLRDLQLMSNEQKSSIQQKSHLTVSLAKQHKETVQLFDRLAHESHLLPAYPVKTTGHNLGHFDQDEMAGREMPGAAHRARAWTYAGESASNDTKDSVLANTEEGEAAVERALNILLNLEQLVGRKSGQAEPLMEDDIWTSETASGRVKSTVQRDIWASLDGNLGVIQRGGGGRLS